MMTADGKVISDPRAPARRRTSQPHQEGRGSGEFALTLFVVAAAILAGVIGGIWVAEREGLTEKQADTVQEAQGSPSGPGPAVESEQGHQTVSPPAPSADRTDTGTQLTGSKALGLRSIRAIRYSSDPDLARIEIEVENVVLVRAAQLHNPERIYADLRDSRRPAGPAGRMQVNRTLSIASDLVAGIRLAQWESGATRIVLDLKRPCVFSHRLTSEPSQRLILEVRPRQARAAVPGEPARDQSH